MHAGGASSGEGGSAGRGAGGNAGAGARGRAGGGAAAQGGRRGQSRAARQPERDSLQGANALPGQDDYPWHVCKTPKMPARTYPWPVTRAAGMTHCASGFFMRRSHIAIRMQ